jgi:ureidoglycolate dehydrogenase (NAD+)
MPQIVSKSIPIAHLPLQDFVRNCLTKAGLRPKDAALVAESLVASNLRGIDSHGVARLPHYLNRIKHGSINPRPEIKVNSLSPSLARIDGDHGMGQLVMQAAVDKSVSMARETGAGWAAVENSTHSGAMAYFGLQIAKANMLGFAFTHSDSMVVPHAAKRPFFGTNPICLTAPGENGNDLCLDMATSVVPWNTVANAAIEGVEIPADWAVDAEGIPTTDPNRVKGVRAFGAYKGSGLGLMIDVFCSFLLGTPYGPDIAAMYGDPAAKRRLGGLVGAIDITRFRPAESFRNNVAELIRRWNGQDPVDPGVPVLFPGQPELEERQRRMANGIPLGVKLIAVFEGLSKELGVEWRSPAVRY